jgi:hypothetical protein
MADAIQEHHRFAALTRHSEHRQYQQANAAALAEVRGGAVDQITFEIASMVVHPADHLQDQQRGSQQHGALEPLAGGTGQPVAGAENAPAQQRSQTEAGNHAAPEHAQRMTVAWLLAQPGVQNADDQQRFDAFTPDDEH